METNTSSISSHRRSQLFAWGEVLHQILSPPFSKLIYSNSFTLSFFFNIHQTCRGKRQWGGKELDWTTSGPSPAFFNSIFNSNNIRWTCSLRRSMQNKQQPYSFNLVQFKYWCRSTHRNVKINELARSWRAKKAGGVPYSRVPPVLLHND